MAIQRGGARVLVVDDDRHSARTLTEVLDAAGFDTAVVRSARVATSVLVDERVAAVLVSFPVGGVGATTDLVTALRSRPEPQLSQVGIVALVSDPVDARFGLDAEADEVLVRPFGADRLVDAVTEVAATPGATRSARRARTAATSSWSFPDLQPAPA